MNTMQDIPPSEVWQRRTNKVIAGAVVIIGLTMMISAIPQCIYIGLIFIVTALGWLALVTFREKQQKRRLEASEDGLHRTQIRPSPILFLVASSQFSQNYQYPTVPDPEDKPPSYEQILKTDGLPPDYFSVLGQKPPRYDDIALGQCCDIPGVHSNAQMSSRLNSSASTNSDMGSETSSVKLPSAKSLEEVKVEGGSSPQESGEAAKDEGFASLAKLSQ